MFRFLKNNLFLVLSAVLLTACGEDDMYEEKVIAPRTSVVEEKEEKIETIYLPSQIVYQDEIYKNWPYTEAPSTIAAVMKEPVVEETVMSVVNDNPQTYTINAEARIFKPDIIYINPGDTVAWRNMTSHNTVSVETMIPEGANPWASKLGENLKITLDVEGVYAYICQPHIGFGMVGLIVVGNPSNLESMKTFAVDLKGPFRRLIGKLNKVKTP